MPRPALLYSRNRATSSPNLRRPRKPRPEDGDSITSTSTLIRDDEPFLSEPVTLHTFLSERDIHQGPSTESHQSSLGSSTDILEQIPFSHPRSSEMECSIAESAHWPTTPTTPLGFLRPEGDGYLHHRPAVEDVSDEVRKFRDTAARMEHIRFRDDPATVSHTDPSKRPRSAVLATAGKTDFELSVCPSDRPLEPGMPVRCFGALTGEWFTTDEMTKESQHGYTLWRWVSHEDRLYSTVRVDSGRMWQPTTRLKKVAREIRKYAKNVLKLGNTRTPRSGY
ncbi:hypothetical protein C8R47DRAFT_1146775 [Mycena vitilis]|nr:hypothetical protein C8R47DRAFT_1146775 [Mycena vitilis]